VKLGAKIFGVLSGVLIVYLLLGLLLPGTWEAETEATLPYPTPVVFPFLNRVDRWTQWNTMPDSGLQLVGPGEGVGAGLEWDDPQYGKGQFRILTSRLETLVEYEVLIEGGSLRIHGSVDLEAEGETTRLRWVERGDFGRNPLMGYAARGMGASQREAMQANLQRLLLLLGEVEGGGA